MHWCRGASARARPSGRSDRVRVGVRHVPSSAVDRDDGARAGRGSAARAVSARGHLPQNYIIQTLLAHVI